MTKEKKENKICGICKDVIFDDDHHCRVTEYKEEKEVSNGFYHLKCFKDRYFFNKKVEKDAANIFPQAQALLNRLTGGGQRLQQ